MARRRPRTWLRACGAKVKVTGKENLEPGRNYVFVSNHRSYLDTATLFFGEQLTAGQLGELARAYVVERAGAAGLAGERGHVVVRERLAAGTPSSIQPERSASTIGVTVVRWNSCPVTGTSGIHEAVRALVSR